MTALSIARACLQAYVDKDRTALEALLTEDFRFTSPLDNAIDRATYFDRCWPASQAMSAVRFISGAEADGRAFMLYEAQIGDKRVRNCELHTTRGDRLAAVEVYFGWNLPHPAAPGGFIDDEAKPA